MSIRSDRKHNFNPGPSVLPLEVLEQAKKDLVNFRGTGVGVLEMGHRTAPYETMVEELERDIRSLMSIPDSYSVILCTGGATNQFSMVPMNLIGAGTGNYLVTGIWGEKAYAEGSKFGKVHASASSKDTNFAHIPSKFHLTPDASYLHFTSNNTVEGTQFHQEPEAKGVPLVCDASSDILTKRIDITRYGILYAGAQKNVGTAGITIVILRNDLLDRSSDTLPVLLDYRTHVTNRSMYNTPPVFAIYLVQQMLQWIRGKGGVSYFEKRSRENADRIYQILDAKPIYKPCSEKSCRSLVNITFRFKSKDEEARFLQQAEEQNMYGVRGHKTFGGIRLSLYNAIPQESVDAVCTLLEEFA